MSKKLFLGIRVNCFGGNIKIPRDLYAEKEI